MGICRAVVCIVAVCLCGLGGRCDAESEVVETFVREEDGMTSMPQAASVVMMSAVRGNATCVVRRGLLKLKFDVMLSNGRGNRPP